MWDDEVDVVCCGLGLGALAAAVAAVDADLDVFVARPGNLSSPESARPGGVVPWLGAGIEDPETREYFDELSADLDALAGSEPDTNLSIRTVGEWTPVTGRGRIAPFYGDRLREWAHRCLVSPYGVLYTRLTDRGTTPMKAASGEEIQVKVVGVLETDQATNPASALSDWLLAQVRERQIPISDNSTLQRIVFEEGEVLGAVIDTADGPLALRARHGVAIATDPHPAGPGAATGPLTEPGRPLQVGLVGYTASRFGRIELLQPETDGARSAFCHSGRNYDGRREPGRSHARRGREMHRYPPFGQ
ncbi:hypothetical protein M2272_003700 [Mycobacterium frederiksbergense]|uniref:FAD-dependent oxidoreductase 2 FAD-binding domain-containing protein n=1 Tax=Mycolicibacterium frederiksbergense TaxID=117567 RepID=A0ABT6L261_9MYCO|nr:FAD-binding protein [Mycolicibacterium frederiksbergense]MDH6197047.1 hypothetical protein [Mycolicibacterium frederiksbergense]